MHDDSLLPLEAAQAVTLVRLGERFGTPPHEVRSWPLSTLRLIEIEGLVTKAQQKD
ncbi:MAG: hypothetical protein AB7H92_14045 [Microbacteriaceae bacterium]